MKEIIKQGFIQYIQLASSDSGLSGNNSLHKGIADLCETCLELATNEEELNLFIIKPFMRATIFALNSRLNELKAIKTIDVYPQVQQYEQLIKQLTNIVDSIQDKKVEVDK